VKVVELGDKRKSCQFCGKTPACPDWTCERIHAVTMDADGGWTVDLSPLIEVHLHVGPDDPDETH
jgi:hypothetical protein